MKGKTVSVITGIILGATMLLYLIAFQVRESERAFVTRFGEVVRSQTKPGLYWKWPWPVERVYRFDGRMHVFEGAFQETMTNDNMSLIVSLAAGWSIDDPVLFYNKVGTVKKGEDYLKALLANSKNSVVGRHDLAHFVSPNPKERQFEKIEEEIMQPVATQCKNEYGIKLHFVRITQLGLPTQVSDQVFQRMKAERKAIADAYKAEGERQAKSIRAEAEKQRKQILAQADAEAKRIRGEGDAKAAEYYEIFKKNPDLTIFLAELEALRKLKKRTTVILDQNTPPYNLLSKPHEAKKEQ